MLHLLAADAVLVLHLVFICVAAFGALVVVRAPKFALVQAPAAVWGFLVEAFGWYCPLTDLENVLLRQAGMRGYDGGFLERLLLDAIYPGSMTREIQLGLAAGVLVINAAAYGWMLVRWFRNRRRGT